MPARHVRFCGRDMNGPDGQMANSTAFAERAGNTKEMTVMTAPQTESDSRIDALLEEIRVELGRARQKFPGDDVTMLALMEEVGELAKATFEEPSANVRSEAVQVAVMAIRVALDGDGTLTAWREQKGLDPLIDGDVEDVGRNIHR